MNFANVSVAKLANSRSTARFEMRVVYEQKVDVAAERERLTKLIAKQEPLVASAQAKLGNEAFLAKAPAHVVEGLRKQLEDNQVILDNARAALDELNKKYPE
jgi:valyl-tRNA synthetase